jgi:hypothetical protein
VLDLGCGRASSSIFLRREFGVQVWAADLWFSAAAVRPGRPSGRRHPAGDGLEVGPSLAAELDLDPVALGEEQDMEARLELGLADQLALFQRPGRRRLLERGRQ